MRKTKKAPKRADSYKTLMEKAEKGDVLSLARLLSEIERHFLSSIAFVAALGKKKRALRVGITGPPGAGKSSLISSFIEKYRKKDLKVAVLAVDPSSPFSGGALLGDRIRMSQHARDPNVFIRSIGSRGALGGLSGATGAMARVLEAAHFDLIIVETVGVGQTELDVMNVVDATAVVLVPESGDIIQTMKAGILEIADMFIVNKADRPGAELLAHELEMLVEQEGLRKRPLLLTSTTEDHESPLRQNVERASDELLLIAEKMKTDANRKSRRHKGELRSLLVTAYNQQIQKRIEKLKITDPFTQFAVLLKSLPK